MYLLVKFNTINSYTEWRQIKQWCMMKKRLSKIFIYLIDIDILVNAAQNPRKIVKIKSLAFEYDDNIIRRFYMLFKENRLLVFRSQRGYKERTAWILLGFFLLIKKYSLLLLAIEIFVLFAHHHLSKYMMRTFSIITCNWWNQLIIVK